MKLATGIVLAAALLASPVFANAQSQTPNNNPVNNNDDQSRPPSVASPGASELGDGGDAVATPATSDSNLPQQNESGNQVERKHKGRSQKNPYWDPKDWHYLESQTGG